ncbi:MAG: SusC/RagA family TonB-linked outer membrane protein [Parabacteroides sp.]
MAGYNADAIAGLPMPTEANALEQQQTKTVRGVVLDKDGNTIIGANVVQKGTTNGTITDVDGNFSLDVASGAVIQISYIGYHTQEIVVGNQNNLRIVLKDDSQALDEVLVVAYGTQKVRSVTGAMGKLDAEEMADIPVPNIANKMQGKFAGVHITQNNGEPNGGMAIRIRGAASINGGNAPLIVVDGFPISGNDGTGLEQISPEEIENITILKDAASASLYGSRAANGVILVTTKSGKAGKTNVEFSSYLGATQVSKRGRPDVMNAQEFAQFKKEYYEDAAKYEGYTGGVPECYQNPSAVQDGTDWYDVLLQTALTQNYNLSLTGGTDKLKSAVNLNYNNQEGTIINTYSQRYSVRANNTFQPSDRVKFGLNLSGSYTKGRLTGGLGNGRNIIGSSFLMDPQLKYKNEDGTYPVSYSQPGMFANANYYLVLRDRDDNTSTLRGIVNAYSEIGLVDNLKYKISLNADLSSSQNDTWIPSEANGGMFNAPPNPARGNYYNGNSTNWLIENILTWNKTIANDHNVDVLLGYTTQKSTSEWSRINASDYPDDEVSWFNAATTKVGEGDKGQWAMISYLGRLNYDFKEKYLLSVSFRRDGCSRFGSEAKFANFPSVSLGWIASDEAFMKKYDWLSYLKLRASWGKVGNYNIGNYSHLSTIGSYNYVFNGGIAPGRAQQRIGNSNLTWETTESYDGGVDLGLFNDRVFIVYDYYRKTTDGLLYQTDIPYSAGFGSIQSNIGEFRFWGHEVNIETKNMVGEFKWNTSLNLTFDKNKAIKLGTNDTPIGGNNNQEDYNRTAVGMPLGMFYGYVYDGVFMTQEEYEAGPKHASSMVGTVRMKDLNGDGVIDSSDRTYIGNPNPKCVYGITNTFSWKNFDASIVFTGSLGGDILDGTYEWTENIDGVFNVRKEVANRWRSEDNPGNGEIPRTRTGTTELFRYTNSRWVFKNNYITLKNLTVGYTVPLPTNKYVKGLRVYASGQNLFIAGSYPGMNPEASKSTSGLYQGVDHTSYPVSRIYTVGLNVNF